MSTKTEKLNELITQQQSLLDSIKVEAAALDSQQLAKENEFLKSSYERSIQSEAQLKSENESLKKDLSTAKSALFARMANEKLSVFKSTQQRLEKVYYQNDEGLESRLDVYEKNCRESLEKAISAIEKYGTDEFEDILSQLNELKLEAEKRKAEIERFRSAQMQEVIKGNFEEGNKIKNEALTDAEKRVALKQKNIESFIGLNILGKAGVLLFIIGIIMLGRFAYVHLSDIFKGGSIYLLGIVLILIGELFYKKEKTVFSTTLISGGVATLYAAAATCYFAFELYSVKITFILCVVITAIAIFLSNQVKNQVVCAFAAVGGYLPVVALYMIGYNNAAADKSFLPVSCIYFVLLAVVLFFLSYNKEWHIAQFIGYGLHLVAIGGVIGCSAAVKTLPGYAYALPLSATFSVVSFVIYLLMPSLKIFKGIPLRTGDCVLLALNTLSGAVSIGVAMQNAVNNEKLASYLTGGVFLVFALIYGVLMMLTTRKDSNESRLSSIITSGGALIFSMLIIPFMFGSEYAPISWGVEGAVLAIVSINKKLRIPEYAGLACMLLSIIWSVALGLNYYSEVLYVITIAVISACFWIYSISGLLVIKEQKINRKIYYFTEILSVILTTYCICYAYFCLRNHPSVTISSNFLDTAVIILVACAISFGIRFGILKNKASTIFSNIIGILALLATFVMVDIVNNYNDAISYYGQPAEAKWLEVINIIVLIVINIGAEIYFARSVLDLINRAEGASWIYTLAISVTSLALITATIMNHFNVEFSSVIISALYIAVACVLLVIGFRKRFTVIRTGGLVLILCAFAKLCFVDTFNLNSGWKIAAYFAFGAILILISFFYQRFSKKLESEAAKLVE